MLLFLSGPFDDLFTSDDGDLIVGPPATRGGRGGRGGRGAGGRGTKGARKGGRGSEAKAGLKVPQKQV